MGRLIEHGRNVHNLHQDLACRLGGTVFSFKLASLNDARQLESDLQMRA